MGLIYKITFSNGSGKVYIGKTRARLSQRMRNHRYDCKMGTDYPLYRAARKYGWENAIVEILASGIDDPELGQLERKFISEYDCFGTNGYNATEGGDGSGRAVCSPEKKLKLSMAAKKRWENPEVQEFYRNLFKGRKATPEARAKMSASRKGKSNGREGLKHTEESKRQMAESQRKRYLEHPTSEETKRKRSESVKETIRRKKLSTLLGALICSKSQVAQSLECTTEGAPSTTLPSIRS